MQNWAGNHFRRALGANVSSVALALIAAGPQALAQSAKSPATTNANVPPAVEMIVTARKRSESINKVAMSIQAFSGEALHRAGVTAPADLARVTPGLSYAVSSANTPIYTLRGIGFNTPNLSSTSPVGLYFDEVAYAYPYMSNGPLFDLQRVEVLKGPQGTLYGRNTTGGLVNFITAAPKQAWDASITGEVGNYKTHNVEGYINIPLSDSLALRLSGRSELSDEGWQHSISRDDTLGKKDRLGVRTEGLWTPTEKLKVNVTASYWRDTSDTVAAQAIILRPEQPAFVLPGLAEAVHSGWKNDQADWDTSPRPQVNSEFFSLTGRADYQLNDIFSLVSLTGYNHVHRNDYNDQDGTQYPVFGFRSIGQIGSFSQEVRANANFRNVSIISGAYYSFDQIKDDQIGTYIGSSTGALLRYLAQDVIDPTNRFYSRAQYANGFANYANRLSEEDHSASVFTNADWSINDKFKLTGGLRYTDDELKNSACSADYDGETLPIWNTSVHYLAGGKPGAAPLVVPNGCMTYTADYQGIAPFNKPTLSESNLASRVTTQYSFDNNLLGYATLSKGYKSGAVPVLPAFSTAQYTPAKQENVIAYEAGIKASLFDRRLRVQLAGFYYDYTDKQLFSEVPDVVFTALKRIVNVPKSYVAGTELEAAWQATHALSLHGGVSYTKSDITKFLGYDTLGHAQDFAGSSFPYTPVWQLTGGALFEQPVSRRLGLSASLDGSYQSSTSTALGNERGLYLEDYALVNGTLGLFALSGGWRGELYVHNLFNKNYWTTADVATDTVYRLPGMTRTFGARVNFRFH